MITSCGSPFDKENLHGKWEVQQWKVEGTEEVINAKMDFDFKSDKQYQVDYGSKKEQGKYWIVDDFLHTVAEGKSEKSVRILNLNPDTLIFQMNRSGVMERVLLVRP